MKNLLIYVLFITSILNAQVSPQQRDLMNFEPGELIVKLKDNLDAGITYAKNGKATSSFNIGQLLGISDKVKSSTMMFHQKGIEASIVNKEKMKAVYAAKAAANPNNGYSPKEPLTMKNIFVLKTSDEQENILQLIQQIIDDPNVEYAEPNYIYSIDNFEVGDVITAEEASKMNTSNNSSTIEVNDPLYSSQTNITSTNIDDVWEQYTTGDGSQVIAILDTGGDYTHPDLEANTWINELELNGVEGYDDDGNGYVDDIRGWDFINLDNAPLDDNMHGTHVAGIAGAVGNNGIGIAGAAWDVKLMHIKVFQSSGVGNSTTIAAGVEYASSNGATILNMSFGSYAESSTLKLALENAYATSILVAAAGNNLTCLGPDILCLGNAPFYPAAYSYVLGVQDSAGVYDNYDLDGPISSYYGNLLNYELQAPGTSIISTIPNGGYATLTGTSMAAPLVAGGLALYKEQNPDDSNELTFGSLIQTSDVCISFSNGATITCSSVNFLASISTEPVSKLYVINNTYRDEINSQNGNGFWEPGETIEILPMIKNFWGPTDDVRVGIEFAQFEDTSKATIVEGEIQIGSITAYATLQDLEESLKITIAEGVNNNVDIKFVLTAWSGPNQDYISDQKEIVINVVNAEILTEYITEDMTLTNDKEWIFQNSMVVSNGATLTIEAGTTVKLSDLAWIIVDNDSSIFSNGTAENPVIITSSEGSWKGVKVEEVCGMFIEYYFADSGTGYEGKYYLDSNSNGTNCAPFSYPTQYNTLEEVKLDPFYSRAKFDYTIFKNFGKAGSGEGSRFQGPVIYENCLFTEFDGGRGYSGGGSLGFDYGIVTDSNIYYGVGIDNHFDDLITTGGLPIGSSRNYLRWDGNILSNINIAQLDWFGDGIVEDNTLAVSTFWINIRDNYSNNLYYSPTYLGKNEINLTNIKNVAPHNDSEGFPVMSRKIGISTSEAVVGNFPSKIWVGTNSENILNEMFWHYGNSQYFVGQINWDTRPSSPFEENHGIVWKVEVNGKDAQDEYDLMDPVGVGTHEFKVYFNRAMDTSVDPQVSYGVIAPYVQSTISEEGTWSSDGKIYTVNHEINIGAADGINRIRVQDAQDLDYFKIPIEDHSYNFLLQSAGSASTGFFAEGGLGKIDLEWTAPNADEIDDALGYNMYRYQVDADGVESTPVKLNETLIVEDTDESTTGVYYTDFDVVEGETYFYKYNILRTSFETTDYSSVVSTAPLTSTLGDSNGDFEVNVLDLSTECRLYIRKQPRAFHILCRRCKCRS